jgi:Uma2 family endonuclease
MKAVETPPGPLHGAKIWPLSIPAYRVLGEAGLIPRNTELLYGVVYQKISKSPIHSALVGRLLKLLREIPLPGYAVRSEQPITCENSEPEPDVAVVRGVEESFWNEHPRTAELVIEVCVSSHDFDRSKLGAYASAAVREVWFVLVPEKKIEVHLRPVNGQFSATKTYSAGRAVCQAVPGFELEIGTVLREMSRTITNQEALSVLLGKRLAIWRRAANLLVLHLPRSVMQGFI